MTTYTDNKFGISFAIPASWQLHEEPVVDPSGGGWFPDAKIVREFEFRNPAAANDDSQLPGLRFRELVAPAGLTELGRSKSPSPVGIDEKYFFDSKTHQWLITNLTEAPDGTPPSTTTPLKFEHKTMGGLPYFLGAVRGGAEVIVPLDASHFLAINPLDFPDDGHTYLAKTVMSVDPHAYKRESPQVQADTIRQEAVKLGVIAESIGFWYKDSQFVYNFDGVLIRGANPKTFAPLSNGNPGDRFATDGIHVYEQYMGAIPGADPKTFVATGNSTAEDSRHIYDWRSGSLKVSPK
jgi:hypothetical protein